MTPSPRTRLTLFLLAGLLTPSDATAQRSAVDTLRWLSGCWWMSTPTLSVEEYWLAPRGGVMLGMSRTVREGAYREHEFLRIPAPGDTLIYVAMPSSQPATDFRVRNLAPTEVTFENLAHDFPQRIRYRLAAADLLLATVEGDREGRRQPLVFSYRRAECGSALIRAPERAASPDSTALTPASVRAALGPRYATLVEREMTSLGAMNSWFAEQADSGFAHVMWTGSSQTAALGSREVLAAAGERMRLANAGAPYRNRRYTTDILRVLLRGDTAEVLVGVTYSWVFADTAGRYGARGAELERVGTQRRIDRWVRSGDDWRLRQVSVISEEISVGGKLVARDGVAVKPVPE